MEKHITDAKTNISYTLDGDYYLPDLALPEEETAVTLGRWGRAHKDWLKSNKPLLYSELLMSGKLMRYCKEIEDTAEVRLELIVSQMAQAEGVTEQFKADDQMEWVMRMNNIRNRAEEIIRSELIYL